MPVAEAVHWSRRRHQPSTKHMDPQRVSEIFFEETYEVPPHQTARSLFQRLPHGLSCARTLIECLATSYLIAVVESICIREMQRHVEPTEEVVVGRTVRVEHLGPVPPKTCLRLCGWVEGLCERSATFCVRVYDDHEVVFEGTVTLVAARRTLLESRIATKVNALQRAQTTAD